jgi:hypothetical protein
MIDAENAPVLDCLAEVRRPGKDCGGSVLIWDGERPLYLSFRVSDGYGEAPTFMETGELHDTRCSRHRGILRQVLA